MDERSFGLDLWAEGVEYLSGWSTDLREVAGAIHFWLADAEAGGETAAARFRFLAFHEFARAYERGEAIDFRWRSFLGGVFEESDALLPLIEAAAAEPRLRRLYPYVSLDTLMFSRWVGHPFSNDLPSATPNVTSRLGTYHVRDAEGRVLGEGDAARAVEILTVALPEPLDVVYRRPAETA